MTKRQEQLELKEFSIGVGVELLHIAGTLTHGLPTLENSLAISSRV